MKASLNTITNNYRYLTAAIMLGFIITLTSGTALAQAHGKNKKADRLAQATLKEAKVVARVVSTVEEISPMRVKLNVLNPTGKTVRIAILDYRNTPVFLEDFTGKEYIRTLNFRNTTAGNYKLRVTGPKQSETHPFAINSKLFRNLNQAELTRGNNEKVMAIINKPAPNKIKLHLLNNSGEGVNYVFRNDAQEVIYSGKVKNRQFTKIFDMSAIEDGKYTLEVNHHSEMIASRAYAMHTGYNRSFAWTDKRGKPLNSGGLSVIKKQSGH